MDNCITEDEIEMVVNSMKFGKTGGLDGITIEVINYGREEFKKILQTPFQKIWNEKRISER